MGSTSRFARSAALVAFAWLVLGLPTPRLTADDSQPPAKSAAKHAADKAALPSEEECREWAAHFEKAVKKGDLAGLNDLVDWDALLATATEYPNPPAELVKQRADFVTGARSASRSGNGFTGQLLQQARRGGTYKFLRCREVDGRRRAEFRLITKEHGINYHDFVLASGEDGLVRAVDCYIFLTGQMLTTALREAFLPFAQKWIKGGLEQLPAPEREFLTHFADFTALVDASRDKEHRQVLDIYERLPASMKKMKTTLALRLGSAQFLSEDEYLRAIEDYRKYYPNDASVDLVALDAFTVRKDYKRAMEGVERIDKAVGGDPYLKVLRGNLFVVQGQLDAAWKMDEAAVAEEPTLTPAYFALVAIALQKRDFAKTAELLSDLESKCNVKFKDLTTVPAYAQFVKSDEYKKWLKAHGNGE
ncbi:MAG TPA: hypothetical protein VEI07_08935 [Planctomycetaceae bacterium]|nr:hypothetical protein [Planctomycetaceae bacterium]